MELALPVGVSWGDIGKIFYFNLLIFFGFLKCNLKKFIFFMKNKNLIRLNDHDTNVGPVKLEGLPRHMRHDRDVERETIEFERVLHTF